MRWVPVETYLLLHIKNLACQDSSSLVFATFMTVHTLTSVTSGSLLMVRYCIDFWNRTTSGLTLDRTRSRLMTRRTMSRKATRTIRMDKRACVMEWLIAVWTWSAFGTVGQSSRITFKIWRPAFTSGVPLKHFSLSWKNWRMSEPLRL